MNMITISSLATPKELYYSMYHDYRYFMWKNSSLIMKNPDHAHGVLIDRILATTRRYIQANNVATETRDRLYVWIMAQYRKFVFQPNFYSDVEKMRDFRTLTKDEFLQSYSYLTEKEYDNTLAIEHLISDIQYLR